MRHERESRFLTQQALADLAGMSQGGVARIERGDRMPSIPLVERAFAALGRQLAVAVEPLDTHLDARMDELAARPLADRIDDLGLDWLDAAYGQRWNARWNEFGGLRLEPAEPGEHRWQTRYGEVRAQMCDELPEAIEVRHGERSYRVVPLVAGELTDPRAAELLRRHRQRQAGSVG
ncbi:helix-turn-helix domain-containing protein [Micromonospora sp. DT47]|uniref:helix-turn-helix domain-containing protein n=1 Tax=Micromonospora sp. DT47 TaxID=3393431 RepID=UPI003CF113E7